ncbi:MAG: helix-turn-helix domain-containing protein, partial [Rikenellaceae bacterium]
MTVIIFMFIGIAIRWETEAKIHKTIALMSILVLILCVLDFILCETFEYHPLMLRAGSSFGTLFFNILITSFIYIYFKQLLEPITLTTKLMLKINAPLIVVVACYSILSLFRFKSLPNYNIDELIVNLPTNPFAILWFIGTIIFCIYTLLTLRLMYKSTINVLNMRNNTPIRSNLKFYFSFFIYVLLWLMAIFRFTYYLLINKNNDDLTESISISIIFIFIYIFSYIHTNTSIQINELIKQNTNSTKDNITINRSTIFHDKSLIDRLDDLMIRKEIFKRNDLTTTILAKEIGISRKKLYFIIKQQRNATFIDYINSYRLEYAIQLMSDKQHIELTINQIANLSGFNSLKTFTKFFKLKYATTP